MLNKQKDQDKQFTFSVAENPNLVPHLKTFNVRIVSPSELKQLFQDYTYSTIIWNGSRKAVNFEYAQGCIIDFDNKDGHKQRNIEEAITEFEKLDLSYALITSKSHTPENHRFHVFIPFNRPIKNLPEYKTVMEYVTHVMFPESDPACTDGARLIFQSPKTAIYKDNFTLGTLDVDDILQNKLQDDDFKRYTSQTGVEQEFDAWDSSTVVTLEDGSEVPGDSVTDLTYCFCKWHDISDTPSAKIGYSEKSQNHFIHCFKCQKTYWKTIDEKDIAERYLEYWAHGGSIYKAGFAGQEFSFQKIGDSMFYAQAGLRTKEQKAEAYEFLSTKKYLHSLGQVHTLGDISADRPYYSVDQDKAITEVHIPAIQSNIADNDFILEWLKASFGSHFEFIVKYTAIYTYTNYEKLPYLIFIGDRGTGKSTFAEWLGLIYDILSVPLKSLGSDFNDFAAKKLAIIDELTDDGRVNYVQLKKLSGQSEFEINRKYQATFKAPNNLNIILLSNDRTPIRLKSSEQPTDELNNQFFVYEMPTIQGPLDNAYLDKLKERTGHFIRTYLEAVFDNLTLEGRYSLEVPITGELLSLYDTSKGELDLAYEELISDIIDVRKGVGVLSMPSQQYGKWIKAGYIPSQLLADTANNRRVSQSALVRRFKEEGIVSDSGSKKIQLDKDRLYCYEIGTNWAISNGIA